MEKLSDPEEQVRGAVRAALDALSCAPGFDEAARGLDRKPSPLSLPRPQYPRAALDQKLEGKVVMELLIGRDGRVARARVLESVPGLDEAASECVRSWLFAPAIRGGRLVATVAHAPVVFSINGRGDAASGATAAAPTPSGTSP